MIFINTVIAVVMIGFMYGSYLMVRDAEVRFQKRRAARQD